MAIVRCEFCGKDIERSRSKIKRKNFCSYKCHHSAIRLDVPLVKCDYCGKEIYKKPSDIKRFKNSFCSRECYFSNTRSLTDLKTHKVCVDCKEDKQVSEYYSMGFRKSGSRKLRSCCKKCSDKRTSDYIKSHKKSCTEYSMEYNKKYYRDNRDKVLKYYHDNKDKLLEQKYKRKYGVTVEQVDETYKKQNGLCAICKVRPAINIDHNHLTGRFRGILCGVCNRGLGMFYDDPLVLSSAITYLEKDSD